MSGPSGQENIFFIIALIKIIITIKYILSSSLDLQKNEPNKLFKDEFLMVINLQSFIISSA